MTRQLPNILVILTDQWRAEALGCTGNTQVQTPAADRLAREGALIERAYCTDPVCTPARAALITGRYPHTNGATDNRQQLPAEEIGFAEVLTAQGYACGYVGKWHLNGEQQVGTAYVPPGPLRQGFDAYWVSFRPLPSDPQTRIWESHLFFDHPEPEHVVGRFDAEVHADLGIAWLRRQVERSQRFCLVVSMRPPHPPHNAPWELQNRYSPQSVALPPNVPAAFEARAREYTAGYLPHVCAADVQVGRLLEALDTLGVAGDTLVAFTSDHGDQSGSHGYVDKNVPYDECTRVPMAWRWPGRIAAGLRPDLTYGHVDFAPTLLGLCGAPIPEGVQGTDLSPWLLGSAGGPAPQEAYLEARIGSRNPEQPEWRGLRTRRHWCAALLPPGTPAARLTHLFDMEADPYQLRNLAGDPSAANLEAGLHAALLAAARRSADPHPAMR